MTSRERAYFSAPIEAFLATSDDEVLGALTARSEFAVELPQRQAWQYEIQLLRKILVAFAGRGLVILEFVLPRLGRRIDAVLIIDHLVLVLEFKVGEKDFNRAAMNQAWDRSGSARLDTIPRSISGSAAV